MLDQMTKVGMVTYVRDGRFTRFFSDSRVFTAYIMLIAMSYRQCGRNLRAKLDIAINSLFANNAYLKTVYWYMK